MNTKVILAKLKQYPIAVVAAVAAIVFSLVIYLRISKPAELEAQFNDRDSVLKVMESNAKQAVDLDEQIKTLAKQTETTESALMVRKDKVVNYQSFYEIEKASGARITNIVPDESVKPGDGIERPQITLYDPITWRIEITGNYTQILSFFYELQSAKYFITVTRFELSPSAVSSEKSGSIRATLAIEVLGKKS